MSELNLNTILIYFTIVLSYLVILPVIPIVVKLLKNKLGKEEKNIACFFSILIVGQIVMNIERDAFGMANDVLVDFLMPFHLAFASYYLIKWMNLKHISLKYLLPILFTTGAILISKLVSYEVIYLINGKYTTIEHPVFTIIFCEIIMLIYLSTTLGARIFKKSFEINYFRLNIYVALWLYSIITLIGMPFIGGENYMIGFTIHGVASVIESYFFMRSFA